MTIRTAMTAAETGHLVISTLHTPGARRHRRPDHRACFPSGQQQQSASSFSMLLRSVISQQLIPAVGGGLVPAFEIHARKRRHPEHGSGRRRSTRSTGAVLSAGGGHGRHGYQHPGARAAKPGVEGDGAALCLPPRTDEKAPGGLPG